mmetsp:Transcript_10432/g.63764  ORF Transcript_10432/g.63764 Transcript_10432/m.63764 type:complete len:153 (-) Transcript_10432:759-1217(-)
MQDGGDGHVGPRPNAVLAWNCLRCVRNGNETKTIGRGQVPPSSGFHAIAARTSPPRILPLCRGSNNVQAQVLRGWKDATKATALHVKIKPASPCKSTFKHLCHRKYSPITFCVGLNPASTKNGREITATTRGSRNVSVPCKNGNALYPKNVM